MAKTTWFYYDSDGKKQGPYSGGQLKWLAKNGKITPGTMLKNDDGQTAPAGKVQGLTFASLRADKASLPVPVPTPTSTNPFTAVPVPSVKQPFFESGTPQYDNSSGRKINKVIVVENTVRGADAFFSLLFPFQDNFYAEKLEDQFSETLAIYNQQGWNVVSVTYGFVPHAKLSTFQRVLLILCMLLLIVITLGIYLIAWVLLAFFKRGRIDQYTVILEKTFGSENAKP